MKKRLEEYKKKKYFSINHEEIKDMVKEIIERLTELLFNDNIKLTKILPYELIWGCHNNNKVMQEFLRVVNNYKNSRNYYLKMKEEFRNADCMSRIIKHRENDFLQAKIEIITWYNQIKKLKLN